MSTDVEGRLNAANLTHAKRMVETTLEGWDLLSWNELLADDVILSVKVGEFSGLRADLQVTGQGEAKRVLKNIYGDLRKGLFVTTELISGSDAILLGNWSVRKPDIDVESVPVVIYMAFNAKGRIRKMTIASVDLHPLIDAMRNAAEGGGVTS
jgi:hypothetical protein